MDFEKTTRATTRRNPEVYDLLERFMESDVQVAKVKDWEDDYASIDSIYSALKRAIKARYPGVLKTSVTKTANTVYIEKL